MIVMSQVIEQETGRWLAARFSAFAWLRREASDPTIFQPTRPLEVPVQIRQPTDHANLQPGRLDPRIPRDLY